MQARFVILSAAIAVLFSTSPNVRADDDPLQAGFSYQGYLTLEGSAVTGAYDFEFTLWSDATSEDPDDQVGGKQTVLNVTVTNGLFTTHVNEGNEFGLDAFYGTSARWLQIGVRENGSGDSYDGLAPRQPIRKTPYAQTSERVDVFTQYLIAGDRPLWYMQNTGLGSAGFFSIRNVNNGASALFGETNGKGDACELKTAGGGRALWAYASEAGSAGLFEIQDRSNRNDALLVKTAGLGGALRATATSGVGLLAESGKGVGLRTTSAEGTALDVVGVSAFSDTASFEGKTPMRIASATLIENLNAELLGDQPRTFFQNAGNLTAGVLPDGRLGGTYSGAINFANNSNVFTGRVVASTDGKEFAVGARTSESGAAIGAETTGIGRAGLFLTSSSKNSTETVLISSAGGGPALRAEHVATGDVPAGNAGEFVIENQSSNAFALLASTDGQDDVIRAQHAGSAGNAGEFRINNTGNVSSALLAFTAGTGLAANLDGDVRVGGDLNVIGNLSKGGGSFKIDHPLDPANKYLYHSFVESPDMMNIYNGNAVLDERGEAWVELPEWFGALNRDFRYQLTCIGGFAPVYVASEVSENRFQISGGRAGLRVSWQITGIRQDAYANAHRIPLEVDKPAIERGRYLHPGVFGLSADLRVGDEEAARAKRD